MCGIIWFVQVVHYPGMHHVDREDTYYVLNAPRTASVVVPFMVVEIVTGFLMILPPLRPPYVPQWVLVTGFVLIVAAWAVTFARQVPRHQILIQCRYNGKVVDALIRINWQRTAIWSVRAIACVIFLVLSSGG